MSADSTFERKKKMAGNGQAVKVYILCNFPQEAKGKKKSVILPIAISNKTGSCYCKLKLVFCLIIFVYSVICSNSQ